jgi:hypothetical protein
MNFYLLQNLYKEGFNALSDYLKRILLENLRIQRGSIAPLKVHLKRHRALN